MNGNMNLSYVKSCSIHQSFNRAINVHASHYVTIEKNVLYNIMYVFTYDILILSIGCCSYAYHWHYLGVELCF